MVILNVGAHSKEIIYSCAAKNKTLEYPGMALHSLATFLCRILGSLFICALVWLF